MRKVGDYVWDLTREAAESLNEKYVICCDLDHYYIFDRDTGEVIWVGEEGLLGAQGYRAARSAFVDGVSPTREIGKRDLNLSLKAFFENRATPEDIEALKTYMHRHDKK